MGMSVSQKPNHSSLSWRRDRAGADRPEERRTHPPALSDGAQAQGRTAHQAQDAGRDRHLQRGHRAPAALLRLHQGQGAAAAEGTGRGPQADDGAKHGDLAARAEAQQAARLRGRRRCAPGELLPHRLRHRQKLLSPPCEDTPRADAHLQDFGLLTVGRHRVVAEATVHARPRDLAERAYARPLQL